MHANTHDDGVDYLIRAFVGGQFTLARRKVRVTIFESGRVGSITSEVISAESSSSTPVEHVERTLLPFVKELILAATRVRAQEDMSGGAGKEQETPRRPAPSRTKGGAKKSLPSMNFDLSQLGALRRALLLLGIVNGDEMSVAWAMMEGITYSQRSMARTSATA